MLLIWLVFDLLGMWDSCWLPVLSARPVEKVLCGALTPSTAQTWSKPWRSSTSLPRMPSPHRLPPHPGNELGGAHDVTAVFSLLKPESDPVCLCVARCSASSPPRHLFLQGCSFKGKAGWVFTSFFFLEPSCVLYLSVCSILIMFPWYIQHHCAFSPQFLVWCVCSQSLMPHVHHNV